MECRKIPPDLSANDVHQWINGGVCLLEDEDTTELVSVVDVLGDENDWEDESGEVIVAVASFSPSKIKRVRISSLSLWWPRFGSFNLTRAAVHVRRSDIRQYRRTFNGRSYETIVPEQTRLSQRWRMLTNDEVRIAALAPFMAREEYYSYREARTLMQERERYSCALNRRVIITSSNNVYYNGMLWGKMDEDRLIPLAPSTPKAVANCLGEFLW